MFMKGRNSNTNDVATLSSAIVLNTTTSTTIVAANENRIEFYLSNSSSQGIFVKFQAASIDNDQKGIFLFRNAVYEMPTDNIYTGEISAIAEVGTPTVFATEY